MTHVIGCFYDQSARCYPSLDYSIIPFYRDDQMFTAFHVNLRKYSHPFLYCFYSDDQEILDESPMKVGSELISMSVDPQLPDRLRVPVTITLKNTNVCPL